MLRDNTMMVWNIFLFVYIPINNIQSNLPTINALSFSLEVYSLINFRFLAFYYPSYNHCKVIICHWVVWNLDPLSLYPKGCISFLPWIPCLTVELNQGKRLWTVFELAVLLRCCIHGSVRILMARIYWSVAKTVVTIVLRLRRTLVKILPEKKIICWKKSTLCLIRFLVKFLGASL